MVQDMTWPPFKLGEGQFCQPTVLRGAKVTPAPTRARARIHPVPPHSRHHPRHRPRPVPRRSGQVRLVSGRDGTKTSLAYCSSMLRLLGEQKITWLLGKDCGYDMVLLQEHKLRGKRFTRAIRRLSKKYDVFAKRAPTFHKGGQGWRFDTSKKGESGPMVHNN